ncbi:MAG: hypothetical protein ACYC6T_14295 [Thermoleophilia bacterium]
MKRVPVTLLLSAAALVLLLAGTGCGLVERHDQVSAQLTAPGRIDDLDLTELWGRVSQAAGVDAAGASLEDLNLVWGEDGSLWQFNFQVQTADGYSLQVGGSPSGSAGLKLSAYGSKVDAGFQRSSWSTSLDQTFRVLDALGPRSIERFQQPLLQPEPGGLFGLTLGMRGQGGIGNVGWGPRAFLFEEGRFVRLHPNDERRAFAPGTVVLLSSVLDPRPSNHTATTGGSASLEGNVTATTEMYGTSSADAGTYYLIPPDAWPLDLGDPAVVAPVQSSE